MPDSSALYERLQMMRIRGGGDTPSSPVIHARGTAPHAAAAAIPHTVPDERRGRYGRGAATATPESNNDIPQM